MASCIRLGSIASRRWVPRLLFQSGLYPFFVTFPYLGDEAFFRCFRPCLGLFIRSVVAITLPHLVPVTPRVPVSHDNQQ